MVVDTVTSTWVFRTIRRKVTDTATTARRTTIATVANWVLIPILMLLIALIKSPPSNATYRCCTIHANSFDHREGRDRRGFRPDSVKGRGTS